MAITLRDINEEDEELLREIYACTRAQELAMVPWSDEQREAFLRMQFDAQHLHYHSQYPEADYKIILHHAEPVGRLYVHRTSEGIRIMDITILPAFRDQGLGIWLIRELLNEGTRLNQPMSIWVERFNRSKSFFERLGFSQVQEDGYNLLMEWRPSKYQIERA